jgi:hypothetical protein
MSRLRMAGIRVDVADRGDAVGHSELEIRAVDVERRVEKVKVGEGNTVGERDGAA